MTQSPSTSPHSAGRIEQETGFLTALCNAAGGDGTASKVERDHIFAMVSFHRVHVWFVAIVGIGSVSNILLLQTGCSKGVHSWGCRQDWWLGRYCREENDRGDGSRCQEGPVNRHPSFRFRAHYFRIYQSCITGKDIFLMIFLVLWSMKLNVSSSPHSITCALFCVEPHRTVWMRKKRKRSFALPRLWEYPRRGFRRWWKLSPKKRPSKRNASLFASLTILVLLPSTRSSSLAELFCMLL